MNKIRYTALAVLTAAVFFFGCKNNVRTQDLSGEDNGSRSIGQTGQSRDSSVKNREYIWANEDKRPDWSKPGLKVRLIGAFEAAIVGQKKYDAIGGASGSVNANNNSNVTVQVTEKANPAESDWVNIDKSNTGRDFRKSTVKIEPEGSGMKGVFVRFAGKVTLAGIPKTANKYKIFVELSDGSGKTIASNALPFNVYDTNTTTLAEILKDVKTEAWDQEPWNFTKFGGNNETVTVPKTLKRWFGSHTSGTYGFLGYAVANGAETKQTLIVDEGCDVKLINMQTLSSVNIVVKKGGKLNLQDSSIHGTITVEDGGFFQMNYDHHRKQFATGAQINGQLRLKNGATLGDSLIYSNTNYLANGNVARRNEEPVITVEGSVTVAGKVYVRGDEAPTGNSPKTGKEYPGQPAMSITSGSVTVNANAELGLYGGGRNHLTTNGGEALILNNGKVEGEGRLIAIGGNANGFGSCTGGNAVSGTGTLDVKEAFLEGGHTYSRRGVAGKAYTATVTVTDKPIGQAIDGKKLTLLSDDDNRTHWWDTAKPPVYNYETANKPKIKH